MEILTVIGPIFEALKPFGAAAGLIGLLVVAGLYFSREQRAERRELSDDRKDDLENLRDDRNREREMRRTADQRGNRLLESARYWNTAAHKMRHDRLNDRTAYLGYEERAGIAPLILPDVPELPRFVEGDEG